MVWTPTRNTARPARPARPARRRLTCAPLANAQRPPKHHAHCWRCTLIAALLNDCRLRGNWGSLLCDTDDLPYASASDKVNKQETMEDCPAR